MSNIIDKLLDTSITPVRRDKLQAQRDKLQQELDEYIADEQKSKKYQIIGTVKKVSGLSDKDENGTSVSIVAVKVSTSKTFNAMGRSVKFPAGSIIPVIASNVSAGDKVTLEFDVNKLMFKII